MATGEIIGAKIESIEVNFEEQPFLKPLRLSTGLIDRITEARVSVKVRVGANEAVGHGSIYLSDLWAWPDPKLNHDQRDAELRNLCRQIAADLNELCGNRADHPLELGLRLHDNLCHHGDCTHPPVLARAMCASPFDAAIHDATGRALGRSAFDLYGAGQRLPLADAILNGRAGEMIQRTLRPPVREFPAWLIVGKDDSIEKDVGPWVKQRGYRCFKLKILGKDNLADVTRTVEVYRGLVGLGVVKPRLSVDSNEANPDAESVLEYLHRLKEADAGAFSALEYLEQPTGRDITRYRNDWREVTKLKPVLLDEGLTSLDLLDEAVNQGWSGLALKTCKGQSFILVASAWAKERGLILSLQDLTNPGLSAIHAALFAAHVPTINGVELNSPQFTPAANAPWLPRLAGLLDPHDGMHRLGDGPIIGLGSEL
ncbi:MAG: hypothetical protein IT447_06415 [Phycisphaerales bacterium]|jgi:L-alanine-DL-glutamate epimerase-like enolase superfamily enzyme|nr:hypothetical protein [Phycisphaerales bacterium]